MPTERNGASAGLQSPVQDTTSKGLEPPAPTHDSTKHETVRVRPKRAATSTEDLGRGYEVAKGLVSNGDLERARVLNVGCQGQAT